MKPRLPLRLLFALICGTCVLSSEAADIVKNGLSDSLDAPSSWNGNTAPGASDVAVWDASSAPGTTETPLGFGGDTAWGGIRLAADTPLNVVLGAPEDTTTTLSLGASGIKFKSANAVHELDIYGNLELTAAQTWSNSDGTVWRNGPTVNVHGNLTGSADLTFTSAHGIKASFHGDVSGYTGNINMNQWNNISFARGLTGGNITADTYGGQSNILVEDGADMTYTHTLTLHAGDKATDNGPNSFTLAAGTLTIAGTASITNSVLNIGSNAILNLTGTATLSKANVNIGAGGTLAVSGTTNVNGGTTFNLGTGGALQFIASGAGSTTFSQATTFSGEGTVSIVGTHHLATGNGKITIRSGTTLDLTQGRLVYNGWTKVDQSFVIQGTLKLTDFTYNGSIGLLADYSMNRYLDGGSILVEGATHASGQGFTVTDNGGSFLMTQSGTTLTLSGNANDSTIVFKNSLGTLEMGGAGNIILSGGNNRNALSGHGTLVKTGSGSLTINHQSSSFSGSVILQEGALTVAHNEAVGTKNTSIVYEGGILDLGGNTLANVSLFFRNGKTANDIVNGSNFLGSVSIGDIGAYNLEENMAFGTGYVAEADTVFTLTESMNLGHKADGVRNYINALTHALTLTGEGLNLTIDNYDAVNGLFYGESVTFESIGDITLQNNASSSEDYVRGGAVSANGALSFLNTGNITMQNNAAGESSGAITGYGGVLSAGSGITFDTTGDVNFTGNSAARNGGAIYDLFGDVMMTNVGNVTFDGNEAGTVADDVNDGGAIFEGFGSVTIDTAASLTMTNNKALGGAGGAIFSTTDITASNTGDVLVTDNTAAQSGGAWHTDSGNVTVTQAGTVSFQNNEAGTHGGAISSGDSVSLTDMTGSLTFANNAALNTTQSSDSGNGGAIYAYNDVTISGIEGGVSFTGNHAAMYGGAIAAYNVTLVADRGNIVFNGNTQLGGTTLNAIDSRIAGTWSFDAVAGQEIAFYDPVTSGSDAAVTVLLNGQIDSTGIIRFSGEKVAEHVAADATLDADASRYSDVYADTTLSGGTLILEHGVTYGHVSSDWSNEYTTTSFTGEGGKVALDKTSTLSAQTITMNRTQLDATKGGNLAAQSVSFAEATVTIGDVLTVQADQGLSFGSGVTLHATTPNAALSGTFTITDGIAFALSQENFQTLSLANSTLTINGQLILNDRDINYTLDFWRTEQEFVLLAADETSTISGDFTGIISATTGSSVVFSETPTLPTGQWDYRWDNGNQLVAHWTPDIPEPGSATLLLAAFGASLMRRRRTRAERV